MDLSMATEGAGKTPAPRQNVSVPARLTWKDASGAIRFVSVTTRNISETGVFVDCDASTAIPLYRIVHLQLERDSHSVDQLPVRVRMGRVLSTVWRVGPRRASTGTPSGYALRFLVDPLDKTRGLAPAEPIAVAS